MKHPRHDKIIEDYEKVKKQHLYYLDNRTFKRDKYYEKLKNVKLKNFQFLTKI